MNWKSPEMKNTIVIDDTLAANEAHFRPFRSHFRPNQNNSRPIIGHNGHFEVIMGILRSF